MTNDFWFDMKQSIAHSLITCGQWWHQKARNRTDKKKTRVGGANAPTNQEAAWGLMGEKKTGTDRDTPPLNRTQSDSIVRGPSNELLFADLHLIELKFTSSGFWLDEFQFSLKIRYKINELSE